MRRNENLRGTALRTGSIPPTTTYLGGLGRTPLPIEGNHERNLRVRRVKSSADPLVHVLSATDP